MKRNSLVLILILTLMGCAKKDDRGFYVEGKNKGKHSITKTFYDTSGYDRSGYDKTGYDKTGYDKEGYDRYGYDKEGYNYMGANKDGLTKTGFNVANHTELDINKLLYEMKNFIKEKPREIKKEIYETRTEFKERTMKYEADVKQWKSKVSNHFNSKNIYKKIHIGKMDLEKKYDHYKYNAETETLTITNPFIGIDSLEPEKILGTLYEERTTVSSRDTLQFKIPRREVEKVNGYRPILMELRLSISEDFYSDKEVSYKVREVYYKRVKEIIHSTEIIDNNIYAIINDVQVSINGKLFKRIK